MTERVTPPVEALWSEPDVDLATANAMLAGCLARLDVGDHDDETECRLRSGTTTATIASWMERSYQAGQADAVRELAAAADTSLPGRAVDVIHAAAAAAGVEIDTYMVVPDRARITAYVPDSETTAGAVRQLFAELGDAPRTTENKAGMVYMTGQVRDLDAEVTVVVRWPAGLPVGLVARVDATRAVLGDGDRGQP